jgi:hypothetical protein
MCDMQNKAKDFCDIGINYATRTMQDPWLWEIAAKGSLGGFCWFHFFSTAARHLLEQALQD